MLLERQKELTFEAHNLKEVETIMNEHPGFVKAMWCGDEACELKMKEIKGTKSRCIVDEEPIDDHCVVCGKKSKVLSRLGNSILGRLCYEKIEIFICRICCIFSYAIYGICN